MRPSRAEADVHPLALADPSARRRRSARWSNVASSSRLTAVSALRTNVSVTPPLVVVGRLEPCDVLDEVDADEERVVVLERAGDRAQEATPLRGIEVADRASEQRDQPRPAGGQRVGDRARSRRRTASTRMRGYSAATASAVVRRNSSLTSSGTKRSSVGASASSSSRVFAARFPRRARRACAPASAPRSRSERARQDLALAPRQVVLGQARDLLVELRARARRTARRVGSSFGSRCRPRSVASRRPTSVAALAIARAPQAGEDLPPLREVPVAERRPRDERIRDPRAAAQHAVLAAEERLRVLAVRVRDESRDSRRTQTTSTARPRRWRARARRRRSSPPSPTRPRSAAACPPSARTPRPRGTTRAGPARAAAVGLQYSGATACSASRQPSPRRSRDRGRGSRRPR